MLSPMARYIFITGGVVSSLGKGLASAALGALLQARGYKVRLRKLDPYLNVDPGTMSPYQHGEVFVTSLALSWLAGLGRKPASIINPGAPVTQEAPAGSQPAPLSRSGRGVLDQLQGGAPASAPAAPSGPQVPQSK